MDPTDAELGNINVVEDALDWAGVEGVLAERLREKMGGLQRIREVPLIGRTVWDTAVAALRVPEAPDPTVPGPPNLRELHPVEQARI